MLFFLLLLMMTAQTALAQVTQYKYHITATFTKDDSWDDDGYFTNEDMMLVSGMGQCSFGYDHLFNPGTIDIAYYGYYKRDDIEVWDEEGNPATFSGFEYNIDGSKNGVILQQHDFSVKLNDYVTINFQYKGTVTSYTISYETDLEASAAWYYTKPTLSVSNNSVYTQLHCYQGYTLRHLIMRDASGNETELSFTKGTYTYGAIENQYGSAGQTVATYSASFTMPAKNVTIRAVFNKQTPTVTPPTAIAGLVYDGKSHPLITAGSTTGGTMKYKLNNGNWGTSIPEATNAKNYTLYYKVEGNDEYEDVESAELTVSIAQATNTITAPTARTLTYDGTAQTLLNAGSATFGTMEYATDPEGPYSTTIPSRTDATPNSSYLVWYRVLGNSNYTGQGSTVIHVPIAQCSVTVTATGHTLTTTYDGHPHSVSGYDVSISNNLYTTSYFTYDYTCEATRTLVGKEYAHLSSEGFHNTNNNFNATFNVVHGYVEILPKAVVVTADDVTKEQGDDDALTATITGVVQGENPENVIQYTLSREAGEDIGTYTITPTGNASQNNYSVTFVPGTLTITPKTITTNSAGIMTYASKIALDFYSASSTTNGAKLTAYIVSAFDGTTGTLTLSPVDAVPAGTGLLLKGTPNTTFTIPEATNASAPATNYLHGVTDAMTVVNKTNDGNTNFILANGKYGIDWYTLSEAGAIGANKAYLSLPTASLGSNAAGFTWVYDGETTGIRPTPGPSLYGGEWYDLSGRKLDGKPTQKGLYIHNGKKVVVK